MIQSLYCVYLNVFNHKSKHLKALYEWSQYASMVKELADSFHIDIRQARIEEIEQMMEEAGFWDTISGSSSSLPISIKTPKSSY